MAQVIDRIFNAATASRIGSLAVRQASGVCGTKDERSKATVAMAASAAFKD
jgi:hypothetical protein